MCAPSAGTGRRCRWPCPGHPGTSPRRDCSPGKRVRLRRWRENRSRCWASRSKYPRCVWEPPVARGTCRLASSKHISTPRSPWCLGIARVAVVGADVDSPAGDNRGAMRFRAEFERPIDVSPVGRGQKRPADALGETRLRDQACPHCGWSAAGRNTAGSEPKEMPTTQSACHSHANAAIANLSAGSRTSSYRPRGASRAGARRRRAVPLTGNIGLLQRA